MLRLPAAAVLALAVAGPAQGPDFAAARPVAPEVANAPRARNAILFVGDGMGISTVTATRVFSVGVAGNLVLDLLPYSALSRVYCADYITPDSAATMSSMVTGHKGNLGVLSMDAATERGDFNRDGDGRPLNTLLELAAAAGKSVGIVTTTRITHATPAACYAHANERGREADIALQALPTDPTYNTALGPGVHLLAGGGRRYFTPLGTNDEEGDPGSRQDRRDLRAEYAQAGYRYVWNRQQWLGLTGADLPVLALFESSHMEYEMERPTDLGGEPSLSEMVATAIRLLDGNPAGYFLVVEGGRIDHAHHAGNAYRALRETEQFDRAVGTAAVLVDLNETLLVVTADHGHVFHLGGYPLRPPSELAYPVRSSPVEWRTAPHSGLLNIVYWLDSTGAVVPRLDAGGTPYTALVYGNGPGYRGALRIDPRLDPFPGWGGGAPSGPQDPSYRQEAAVPMSADTHSGEEVALYALGRGASLVHGTVENTFVFHLFRYVLGL